MKTRSILGFAASAVAALLLLASCKEEEKITGYSTVIPEDAVAVFSVNVSGALDKMDLQSLGLPVSSSAVKSIISGVGLDMDSPVYGFVHEINVRRPENTPVYVLAKVTDKSKIKDGLALLKSTGLDMNIVPDGDYSWLESDDDIYGMFNGEFLLLGTQPQSKSSLKSLIGSSHLSKTSAGKKYFAYGGDINAFLNYDALLSAVGKISEVDLGAVDLDNARALVAIDFNNGDMTLRTEVVGMDNSLAPVVNIEPEAFSYLPSRNLVAAFGAGFDAKKFIDYCKSFISEMDLDISLDRILHDELGDYVDVESVKGTFAIGLNGLDRYDDPIATIMIPAKIKNLDELDSRDFEAGYAGKYTYLTNDYAFSKRPKGFDAPDFDIASKGCVYGYLDIEGLAGMLQNVNDRDAREFASILDVFSSLLDCMTLTSTGVEKFKFVVYFRDRKQNSLTQIVTYGVDLAQSISSLSRGGYYDDDDYYYGADDEPGYYDDEDDDEDYYGADDEPGYDDWDW